MKVSVEEALTCMNEVNRLTGEVISRLRALPTKEFEIDETVEMRAGWGPIGFLPVGMCLVGPHQLERGDPRLADKLAGGFAFLVRSLKVA